MATTAGLLQNLVNKDNPYLKSAETAGLQSANRRGLLNSSMAVQAAQQARVNAALPIAQQDSSQAHQLSMQDKSHQNQLALQDSGFNNQQGLLQMQLDSQRDLANLGHTQNQEMARLNSDLNYQNQLGLMDQTNQYDTQRLNTQLDFNRDMQTQQIDANRDLQSMQNLNQMSLAQQEMANRNYLQQQELNANATAQATSMLSSFDSSYNQLLANIANNPDIPAEFRQQMIDQAQATLESNRNAVQTLYNIELNWDDLPVPEVEAEPEADDTSSSNSVVLGRPGRG